MNFWLMKSEPDVFSFQDLLKAPNQTTHWEGVRNYQARNFMRDGFKKGDLALFYHSNAEVPSVVGIARVVREGYPDPDALNPKSDYYDEKAKKRGENPWVMVDIQAVKSLKAPVTREMLATESACKKMELLRRGSRLSIHPVTESEFRAVCELGQTKI